jgi:starch phosphorylase
MHPVRTFVVVPSLPKPLEKLRELAYNLWFSWNPLAVDLFRRLDIEKWEQVGHNPVALLAEVSQKRLEQAAHDAGYVAQARHVAEAFDLYMNGRSWYCDAHPEHAKDVIAYFSAEFGLHESLPVYSGGLGMLAGDHLKSASDLGLPLVAVGMAYRHGYFTQQLTEDGWQMDTYPRYDFPQWPATLARTPEGAPVRVEVPLGPETLHARVFLVNVGRVRLFLLDADVPENRHELRQITGRLYDADRESRIRQELLLGVGGLRVLHAVGVDPTVCHMNEGHSAFLGLERIRHLMYTQNLNFAEAREAAFSGGCFTTHTPVPAGIDTFSRDLIKKYLGDYASQLGLSIDDLLALGREHRDQQHEPFSMAVLALRTAYSINGVSELHGAVARGMWQSCWPGVPRNEVPIMHVTNGIHIPTWISPQIGELFDQYLGPGWAFEPDNAELWERIDDIPDGELWRTHERRRERLIAVTRHRARDHLNRRGAPPTDVKSAGEMLDPRALTIGFARRFAPYKRATLLFRDMPRLASIVNHPDRPVQFLFAGKAHPNDDAGKELLKQVMAACREPEFRGRVIMLDNYDMALAREMVHGVDVWLNNPLRLHEASGTSGMKVVASGGMHLSCADGWWPEGYDGENGWMVGDGRSYDDPVYQDYVDSQSLYSLLEREIVPLYYDRGPDNIPYKWIARMKRSIKTLCPFFNTHRMVREYCEKMYLPSLRRYRRVSEESFKPVREITAQKTRLAQNWGQVRIDSVEARSNGELRVGDAFPVTASIHLGSIQPSEVCVEVYHGRLGAGGELEAGERLAMKHQSQEEGRHTFSAEVPCQSSGQNGYSVRVLPSHDGKHDPRDPGLVVWG